MKFFRPFNIFSVLMIIAGFAFAFRLVNVLTFTNRPAEEVGAIMPAGAQEASNEQPPPMDAPKDISREELQKAVEETARKADELQSAGEASKASSSSPSVPPPDDADVQAFTASELEVLQSLSKRRDELDKRERRIGEVGSSRVDLQACKLEYSIVSPK